jgi:hypothetical protein
MLEWHLTASGNTLNASDPNKQKTPIIIDAVGDRHTGVAFLLDSNGHVWTLRKTIDMNETPIRAFKLSNLKGITKLAPYIAIDKSGRVFTWALDEKTLLPDPNTPPEERNPEDVNIVCTTPTPVRDVNNATLVAYDDNHFVVVENDKDILEWHRMPVQKQEPTKKGALNLKEFMGSERLGPIKKIYSHDGVKSLAITGRSVIALFNDGQILGWGLTQAGQTCGDTKSKIVSFDIPDAENVYLNDFRTIVLRKDGHLIYYGGCGFNHDIPQGVITNAIGKISNVKELTMSSNDSFWPDLFIKKDGSVWQSYAPVPSGFENTWCGRYAHWAETAWSKGVRQVDVSVPALKVVATYQNNYLVLGEDHHLWNPFSSQSGIVGLKKIHIKFEED